MYSLMDDMPSHAGFPHSDTSGSQPTYGYPKTFVVRHVLHRLLVPRHSPCALLHLTYSSFKFEEQLMNKHCMATKIASTFVFSRSKMTCSNPLYSILDTNYSILNTNYPTPSTQYSLLNTQPPPACRPLPWGQIGRASCRERV